MSSLFSVDPYRKQYKSYREPVFSKKEENSIIIKVKDLKASILESDDNEIKENRGVKRIRPYKANDTKHVADRVKRSRIDDKIQYPQPKSHKLKNPIELAGEKINEKYGDQLPIIRKPVEDILSSLEDLKYNTKIKKAHQEMLTQAIENAKAFGIYPGLKVVEINDAIGNGVFLEKDQALLEKGTILGIYSGEYVVHKLANVEHEDLDYAFAISDIIILDKDEHRAVFKEVSSFTENSDYVVYTDAKRKGNWTRFINHSSLFPNCIPELIRYNYMERGKEKTSYVIVISVIKTVNPGEQLLMNYGKEYWGTNPGLVDVMPSTYTL